MSGTGFDWSGLVLGPCVEIFGIQVTYLNAVGGSYTITAIFDESYFPLEPLGRGGLPGTENFGWGSPGVITTGAPCLGVQLSQFTDGWSPKQGDMVIINGQVFDVKEVQPDSKGGAKLLLNLNYMTQETP
jgi:hypothetical protein